FQAEDGIRDRNVTGVQTCALPISLPEERLPVGILDGVGPDLRTVVQVTVRPEVDDLVELRDLRLPQPDVLRVLLAHGQDRLEVAEPLARLAHQGAVRPKLVDVPAVQGW